MTTPDYFYLALIALILVLDYFVLWPAFLRRSPAEPARARLGLWSSWIIMLWTLVLAGVALWLYEGRDWPALRLVTPHGWRLWSSIALILLVVVYHERTFARIARSKPGKIKLGNPHVEKLSPHTTSELKLWIATSISAGICEEFVFRGYLIWAFQGLLGLWGAALLAVIVFAFAHAYQGAKGIVATGIAGVLFTALVLITGSLIPAMVVHAVIDIGSGLIAWAASAK